MSTSQMSWDAPSYHRAPWVVRILLSFPFFLLSAFLNRQWIIQQRSFWAWSLAGPLPTAGAVGTWVVGPEAELMCFHETW